MQFCFTQFLFNTIAKPPETESRGCFSFALGTLC